MASDQYKYARKWMEKLHKKGENQLNLNEENLNWKTAQMYTSQQKH